jgi:hypothetical protein
MEARVWARACAVLVSALLASQLASSAVRGPFRTLSPAVAVAKVAKDLPDRPPLPGDPLPSEPLPSDPAPPTTPEPPPVTEPAPAPELPPVTSPAPEPAPDPATPPASDSAPTTPGPTAPAPSLPGAPTVAGGIGSSGPAQRGSAFTGGARVGRTPSGATGEKAPAPADGALLTTPSAGSSLLTRDRRAPGDDPIAALGFDGSGGTSPGVPAIDGDARSGVKGVSASGGADSDRADRARSNDPTGALSPFGQGSSGGLLILLGLLLALALLVRHELPRR